MEPRSEQRPNQPEFEGILEQSIADGLSHILGQSGLQMVLNLYPLKRISTDPAMFHKILKDIFMESGAAIIEREVAARLLERVGNDIGTEEGSSRPWPATATSSGRASGPVSKKDRQLLRQFLALESPPKSNIMKGMSEETPIELTAATFAFAFKKGI